MAINDKDFYASHGLDFDIEKIQIEYTKRVINQAKIEVLTELQLEIEELRLDKPLMSRGYECYGFEDKTPTEIQQECSEIIQQKINSLKGGY